MALILDHIFIITKPGAPEAQRLSALGLSEGHPNEHPGQGTSNRRFFLDNFTIELLFVCDSDEASTGTGSGLGIIARSKAEHASPFGIVVRVADSMSAPDYPSWQYFPDYFTDDMCFYIGDNSDLLAEPLCICMPPSLPKSVAVPDEYVNPDWQLTELTICVPVVKPTETLSMFSTIKNMNLKLGQPHKMKMQFNNGAAGKSEDFNPDLPLIMEW